MSSTALLSILGSWLSAGAILWLGRTWISERLRQSIANEYAHALERHKAELAATNAVDLERVKASDAQALERHKADLSVSNAVDLERVKASYGQMLERHKADLAAANAVDLERVKASYAQERAIRSLGEDSLREAMRVSHTKRIEAVQVIWNAVTTIGANAPAALTHVDVLLEKELAVILTSPRGRASLSLLSHEVIIGKIAVSTPEIASARLIAGPYLYSLFFAYRAVVARAALLLMEGRDAGKAVAWYRDAAILDLLSKVLSEDEKTTFLSLKTMWSSWVRERIEQKFIDASAAIIRGEELAREQVQQAAAIEAAVREMQARQAKSNLDAQ